MTVQTIIMLLYKEIVILVIIVFAIVMILIGFAVIMTRYHILKGSLETDDKEYMMKITVPEERMDKINFDVVIKQFTISKELIMIRTSEKNKSCEYYYHVLIKSKAEKQALLINIYKMSGVLEVRYNRDHKDN